MKTNLGDDLFVETICRRYPDAQFKIHCSAEMWTELKPISNLANVNLWRTEALVQKAFKTDRPIGRFLKKCVSYVAAKKTAFTRKGCSAVVKIGGSIFMEKGKTGTRPIVLAETEPLPGNIFGEAQSVPPQFLIGANVGPVYTKEYLYAVAEELKAYKSAVFRDKASYNLYRNFPNVGYAPDVIFQYPINGVQNCETERQVFITPIALENRDTKCGEEELQGYYEKMAEVCRYYLDLDYKVVLASFCKREGDLEAIEKIQQRLCVEHRENTKVLSYEGNTDVILTEMRKSEFLICCRFHSIVLSLLLEKPFYPISYGDKTTNLLSDLHYSGNWAMIDKWKDIPIEEIEENRTQRIVTDVEKFKIGAQKQFEKLDTFLDTKVS